MIKRGKIVSFNGEHRWLSNFWPAPVRFGGLIYATVEHAYQAAKTTDFDTRLRIARASAPAGAKKLGGNLKLRKDFPTIRLALMAHLIELKFEHPELAEKLIATAGLELEEGNVWGDRYWGVCDGRGENHLGKIIMQRRAVLLEVHHDALVLAGLSR